MTIDEEFEVVVRAKTVVAAEVVLLELVRDDGLELPAWEPGAHIDLLLPDGLERQYSLCGDPFDRSSWRIGVLREPAGRGGSAYVHESVGVGDRMRVRVPRNHFVFEPAASVLFIAGGIGITPILPMLRSASAAGLDWRLVYAGRSRSTMAFLSELEAEYPDRVVANPMDEKGRLDLGALLAVPTEKTAVYCCGPTRLMDAVETLCEPWPSGSLHLERFEPKAVTEPVFDGPFEVELEFSGLTVTVPPERSILEVVEAAGALVVSSCREGTCGTCETRVVSGEIDHRDSVLTPEEQAGNEVMMICVSRAACPRLVLEL